MTATRLHPIYLPWRNHRSAVNQQRRTENEKPIGQTLLEILVVRYPPNPERRLYPPRFCLVRIAVGNSNPTARTRCLGRFDTFWTLVCLVGSVRA